MKFPIRINKYLALKNISTRRGADELIRAGLVKINGKPAELGSMVREEDKVEVNPKATQKKYIYLAYNKPVGIITHSPQGKEKSIAQVLNLSKDIFPVGRLDKDSHGLIILTNDGRIVDKMLNPKFSHEKEYSVLVDKPIATSFLSSVKRGIKTKNLQTRPAKIKKTSPRSFDIILTEGKNRQIRRMCEAFGYQVKDLKRTRIGNIKLGNLKTGEFRKIKFE